ncbi:MAG TPA: penicillin-binding transpeptidase domain-containing protein [Oscillospiraceae bacterium]|nr:penicillin-binding transpeptidase domain-containing protein [Oscillospiraceae bacterium]
MRKLKEYSRYFFCIFILLAVFIVYALRLADWQIVKGSTFLMKSDTTNTSAVKVDAARGEILDADGNGLAVNKTGYSIVFDKTYMTEGTENKTILELTKLLAKRGETWVDELPITIDAKGKYTFTAGKDKEIAALKSSDLLRLNSYATADQCMQAMIKLYECSSYSPADIRTIVSVRYNMDKSYFSISNPYTFSESVSQDTVSIIRENSQLLPGATIKITTVRQYLNPTLIPHIIGTVGSLSLDDYNEFKKEGKTYSSTNVGGYTFNDHIGVGGIERALESTLRGKAGQKSIETTNTGALAEEKYTTNPTSGNTVYLTLNSRMQAVANASLAKNIKLAQEWGQTHATSEDKAGSDCVRGGVVVLNVKDFSVLTAATYPSYDMSKLGDDAYYSSLLKDTNRPLVNNAFNGIFMPGSAFKPVVASAALQENIINRNTTFYCNHVYTELEGEGYAPRCMGWHRDTNVVSGLAQSCNVFFFSVGHRLNINTLDLYAKRFGLGQKTGIELSESSGTLAGPEERKAAGGTWQVDGDPIQAAIGQSDNAFTPLQLATYCATIANNGVRLKTHLVSKVTDYTRKNIISETKPTVVDNVGVSPANLNIVKEGMRAVCTYGTASSYFSGYSIPIAAKTGTAQNPPNSDNVTFIGFAPYDHPQIAVAVVLEHGAKSARSIGVAQDMFDAYFKGAYVDASGNIVVPSSTTSTASSTASH